MRLFLCLLVFLCGKMVAAPVVAGMARADESTRVKIRDAVIAAVAAQPRTRSGKVRLDATAIVVTGEK